MRNIQRAQLSLPSVRISPRTVGRGLFLTAAMLGLASLSPTTVHAAKVEDQVAALKAVGAEGAGNAKATEAWRQLSQADATALPAILAGLDDANPLAANWLRASVDAIAERELRKGAKLPAAALEKFTLDTAHNPRARRLAFEWLCRADKTAADRLIPKMLNDPSVEFRRDAVARLLTEAETLDTDKKADAAAKVYRQALSGARDLDQVQQIVKKLESYGQTVDVPAHFGYLMEWKLIGPFDNTGEAGFDVANPPEKELKFTAEYPGKTGPVKWVDHATDDTYGKVDLNKAMVKANGVTAYATTEFTAAEARPIELRMATVDANKIWLNGELIAANNVYHAGEKMDQYIARGKLKKGKNVILVKILQNEQKEEWAQDWDFKLRVCDATGTAVLSKDRPPARPKPAADKKEQASK